MRKSGILLPISSIPSPYGIGTFSKQAYDFIDFMKKAGQKLWQILPLGPTGYGDSPYQSFSTFAGNPYYIDLAALTQLGYLTEAECNEATFGNDPNYVDYEAVYEARFEVLEKACKRAMAEGIHKTKEYIEFKENNAYWLNDYALYMAVKNYFDGTSWEQWDEDIRLREPKSIKRYTQKFHREIQFYEFLQFMFSTQWKELKTYANKNGIEIIGDIPIYVAFDSADTWANPELFQLDENRLPIGVSGCPPDAFSKTGQLWGNPLYDWKYHQSTGYEWWMKRIAYCYEQVDILRIDHFRGFDEYWFVPYGDETAEHGEWKKGPGIELFQTMRQKLGKKNVIAEDLGFLTKGVIRLLKKSGYPGMKILQFAFDSREESDYLPHNYEHNCVVYTGTHDNDTTVGWLNTIPRKDKNFAKRYLNITTRKDIHWEFIRAALASVADTAIIPMQDYLGLGSETRINIPSTLGGNWTWRMSEDVITDELAEKIRNMVKLYGRL